MALAMRANAVVRPSAVNVSNNGGATVRLLTATRTAPNNCPGLSSSCSHKARKAAFGGQAYDDLLTRLKLTQAYGRLLRRADEALYRAKHAGRNRCIADGLPA